ncbi:MAG: stage V sporulation protein AB [Lachnospiraceae bacterium]|nr:stage V sporulation protein AB [Lachnospiraceae bacterium]MCI9390338.1 stage V sporulation protein AB [Lachnospiraceae bacterium]MCI9471899.1 stage V sporulation protein AB [Lachnospiraceae bacterium]
MWAQIGMGFLGLCAGGIVASAAVAFLIGLGIIPRYAGITHTADRILLYEDVMMLGALAGNVFYVFHMRILFGAWGLGVYGLFSGIFLGGWILALAEMADIFPVVARRLKFKHGIPAVIIAIALGKMTGSLWFFYKGW